MAFLAAPLNEVAVVAAVIAGDSLTVTVAPLRFNGSKSGHSVTTTNSNASQIVVHWAKISQSFFTAGRLNQFKPELDVATGARAHAAPGTRRLN
jgi:hypothetical protein